MHAVYKLDFTAVTYHVWFERNAKIFQTVQTSAEVVSDARACPVLGEGSKGAPEIRFRVPVRP